MRVYKQYAGDDAKLLIKFHWPNGKVWVGTDNQVHDAPFSQLHNTE